MDIVRLDASLFAKMLQNGLNNLQLHEKEINDLNVFPVADGDTGTNMRLTLENGINSTVLSNEIGKYLCSLSNGMLLGARGNSGVILSQIFKGIYLELSRASTINAGDLRNAFIIGYRTAYESVSHPVEGTILTVTREGIENIRNQIGRNTTIDVLLSMYIGEMRKTVAYTPEMLPVLKNAGVVDSGAMGYIYIVEGMLKYLYGEVIEFTPEAVNTFSPTYGTANIDFSLFNENSTFEDGYCMEFLLQLMKQPGYLQNFRPDEYKDSLSVFGDSIVTVTEGTVIKTHIHTKHPDKVISYCRQYGEFLTFKLENMQLQHNHRLEEQMHDGDSKFAVVAVCDGTDLIELFKTLGCSYVIDGGSMMNPSANDFLKAFETVNAKNIVVLPNNKNTVDVAVQATEIYKGNSKITVLESKSMVEAYYALAMDVSDSEDYDFRISEMRCGVDDTHTLAITLATKDYSAGSVSVSVGDKIAVIDDNIVFASDDWIETVKNGLKLLPDIDQKETCIVFRGADASEDDETALCDALYDSFPNLEINFIYGGQHIYQWLIGIG